MRSGGRGPGLRVGTGMAPAPTRGGGAGQKGRREARGRRGEGGRLSLGTEGADVAALVAVERGSAQLEEVAYRGGQRLVARVQKLARAEVAPWRAQGEASYLITGGTSGLGLALAQWLVERGARQLVLSTR